MAGQIHRQKKTTGFVILDVHCLQNPSLKWDAKGLHSYLMHLPEDWQINMADLQSRGADGRNATTSPMNALIDAGYVVRRRITGPDGKFDGYDYDVFERPQVISENGLTVNGFSVNGKTENGKPTTTKNEVKEGLKGSKEKRDVVSHETTALSSKMDAGQQGVESSKIHGMAAPSEISVELLSPPETGTIETPCGTTMEIEVHPPASVETVSKNAYSPDFEAFWKAYRFPVGSKAMASQKWKRLSDSERASALAALPVHIQSTTTDRNRPRNAEFLPMRCHAVVYLSQKRWEAYADSVSIAVGSSAPTKWDEKYKGYLQTCKQRWPGALETVSFLSKAEYCAFQEGRYLKGISMVGTDMQKSRLMRCHDRWEAGESAARTHSSIWACFLAEMSSFIEKSKAV